MPVAKQPKYLDPQAKLLYDLKHELHTLNRKNQQLQETILLKPTWELHALAHTTISAKYEEKEEEKKLILMHNDIIKRNNTYTFKPKNGGRMYFPSKITGRSIPIQKSKYARAIEEYHTGSLYEKSSVFSELVEDSYVNSSTTIGNSTAVGTRSNVGTGATTIGNTTRRCSGSGLVTSKSTTDLDQYTALSLVHKDSNHNNATTTANDTTTNPNNHHNSCTTTTNATAHHSMSMDTLEDLLRHHGPPGPMVFRVKSPVQRSPETSRGKSPAQFSPETSDKMKERIPLISPLRETTRLGLGKEVEHVPLVDWPKVIRKRVCEGEKERLERVKKEEEKGVLERAILQVEEQKRLERGTCYIIDVYVCTI